MAYGYIITKYFIRIIFAILINIRPCGKSKVAISRDAGKFRLPHQRAGLFVNRIIKIGYPDYLWPENNAFRVGNSQKSFFNAFSLNQFVKALLGAYHFIYGYRI